MTSTGAVWVIVLAAGEGRRLHSLTTNALGQAVPKQFCSLWGGPTLLSNALSRALAVTTAPRICTVVAEQHRLWWTPELDGVDRSNIFVQPRNCGTANGILLPLLHIARRDPCARIVLLPSDHHVDDEGVLCTALRKGVRQLRPGSEHIMLLGIAPEHADPELGYIVPRRRGGLKVSSVERFVEKPTASEAESLIALGSLWNSFIITARAHALLRLFDARIPQVVADMRLAAELDGARPTEPVATAALYERLTTLDFSRQILEGAESLLRVVPVPPCGWSDLGTPSRLAETLRKMVQPTEVSTAGMNCHQVVNLSLQHARLQSIGEALTALAS